MSKERSIYSKIWAMAEFDGWVLQPPNHNGLRFWRKEGVEHKIWVGIQDHTFEDLPDYPNDLNALRSVEKKAYEKQSPGWSFEYGEELKRISMKNNDGVLEYNWNWHASANCRFEALILTLGL